MNCSYTIYLQFDFTYNWANGDIYFYLIKSNNSKYFTPEINTENFQEFPLLKKTKFLLDLSTTKKMYYMTIEYSYDCTKFTYKDIFAYGYNVDDHNNINTTLGKKLDLIRANSCSTNQVCKDLILKDSDDLKYVVFEVSFQFKFGEQINFLQFRYGKQERYIPTTIYISLRIGLILSIPNFLFLILRLICCKKPYYFFSFVMNALFHLAFSNIISKYLYLGGTNSFVVGIFFAAIWGILLFCFIYNDFCDYRQKIIIFNGILSIYERFDDRNYYYSLKEEINKRRKLPPLIKIKATASHEESREKWREQLEYHEPTLKGFVPRYNFDTMREEIHEIWNSDYTVSQVYFSEWGRTDKGGGKMEKNPMKNPNNPCFKEVEKRTKETFSKTKVYKYCSWEDNTNFKSIYKGIKQPFAKIRFLYEVDFDEGSSNDYKCMKSNLEAEAKEHDTDFEIKEAIECPGFGMGSTTYAISEKNICKNIILIILWIIFFILGYSSIFDCFVALDDSTFDILIKKIVSNKDLLRAAYMEKDRESENIRKLNSKKRKKSFLTIELKNQPLLYH